jgi:glycosyltransferase involved in cell wall biosynthesis
MKVCHVTSGHSPFDVRIFHKECQSLARAGYEVTLIAPADFSEERVDGVHILGVPRVARRWQRARVLQDIIGRVRELHPAIVHFHEPEFLPFVSYFQPARVIYDCHEHYAHALSQKYYLPRAVRYPLAWAFKVVEPILARQVDAVVLVEDGQAHALRSDGRCTIFLYNYPRLDHQPVNRVSDGHTLIYTGSHAESKGCRIMIEAMRSIVPRISEARLLLVGPFHNPAYERGMRHLISTYGLERHINLVGPVPQTEVPAWTAQADIGLVPTMPQYQPSVPTKMFEYMLAHLPVVASDLPINRRFVQDSGCGLLVHPERPEAYAEKIVYLLLHPQEARAMGERGYQAVCERFNWSREEDKLLSLYKALLKGDHCGDVESRTALSVD